MDPTNQLADAFESLYAARPTVIASAPGRLEVLGNHTDYNGGLTLSCAVDMRCAAAIAAIDEPLIRLASTGYGGHVETYPLSEPTAPAGHWANYVLGLVAALLQRGHDVPGFVLLIDSKVPASAGLSSSAAVGVSALSALVAVMGLSLSPLQLATIASEVESVAVGSRTGLLDQLSSLLGQAGHLLLLDFNSALDNPTTIAMPEGYCFVVIDSGVKHDLTAEYNERRQACGRAAAVLQIPKLCRATVDQLSAGRSAMDEQAWQCALHLVFESSRVEVAADHLLGNDIESLGRLMFASHASSRDNFRNSHPELDRIIALAEADKKCLGARLSGGGFGGVTIHLVRTEDAQAYRKSLLNKLDGEGSDRWSAVCTPGDGARVYHLG